MTGRFESLRENRFVQRAGRAGIASRGNKREIGRKEVYEVVERRRWWWYADFREPLGLLLRTVHRCVALERKHVARAWLGFV